MRKSGVLMHITSLPGPYGVGTMGKAAFEFVDFLKKAGQSSWQILPLTPTGYGDSPYQSCSTFAGNHYLIDLELLVEEGLLKKEELESICWSRTEDRADFGLLYLSRAKVLRLAYGHFDGGADFEAFCRENAAWLPDFSLFMALKEENGGKSWYQWAPELKNREADAMWQARRRLREEIRFICFTQFVFFRQWNALRAYARENGIELIGDVPIYVPLDSADVWAAPELFQLDEKLQPTDVAGVPPDAFTADGQLWGNPLYNWDRIKKDDYSWWLRRLGAAGKLYDVVRLDHFRGFESYWAVPYGDETARGGKWVKGPDMDFVRAVQKGLPQLRLIAEDLGFLTQAVLDLRDQSGLPGMKVLQFAFDSREPSEYLPHTYIPNTVCYTGTHDNMTTRQWFDTAPAEAVDYAVEYMALTEKEGYVWGTVRTAMSSVSALCITPVQDLLDIGEEGRMNAPGCLSDKNWTWRLRSGKLTDTLAKRLYDLTKLYGRLPVTTANSGESAD